jgi:predicted  nucleic acid-binding Zn-ribbon protein
MLSNATLSPAMKQAFDRISQIRSTMNDAMRREAALEQERGEITTEQDRIRQNLGSLDRTSELAVRLTRKLGDQETRLDAITGEIAAARSQAQKARTELETYLSSLNIDE